MGQQTTEPQTTEEQTIEEAFDQLDTLIGQLEDRNTSLEDSFQLYQRGMQLLKSCSEKIDRVEKKVQIMNEEGELDEFQ